jgi:hypothetical protein
MIKGNRRLLRMLKPKKGMPKLVMWFVTSFEAIRVILMTSPHQLHYTGNVPIHFLYYTRATHYLNTI